MPLYSRGLCIIVGERDTSSSDTSINIPAIGTDASPSSEMIVQGNVGNGSWDKLSPTAADKLVEQKKELARQRKQIFRDGYDQAIEDMHDDGLAIKRNTLSTARQISDRMARGDELTKREHDIVQHADKIHDKLMEYYHDDDAKKQVTNNILNLFQAPTDGN